MVWFLSFKCSSLAHNTTVEFSMLTSILWVCWVCSLLLMIYFISLADFSVFSEFCYLWLEIIVLIAVLGPLPPHCLCFLFLAGLPRLDPQVVVRTDIILFVCFWPQVKSFSLLLGHVLLAVGFCFIFYFLFQIVLDLKNSSFSWVFKYLIRQSCHIFINNLCVPVKSIMWLCDFVLIHTILLIAL